MTMKEGTVNSRNAAVRPTADPAQRIMRTPNAMSRAAKKATTKYFPFNAATAVVATPDGFGGGGGAPLPQLEPNTALLVVTAWLVGALVVTALFTERAEISG